MSYVFYENNKKFKATFTSELKSIVCLKDYHVFLYFKSGYYQIWNLNTDHLVISKALPKNIVKFSILNDTCLCYLQSEGSLKVHNIFKNSEDNFFSTTIPTTIPTVLVENNNYFGLSSEVFKQNVITQCILYTDQEEQLIYLIERVNTSFIKIHHTISIFNLATAQQALYYCVQEHTFPFQFTFLQKSRKFALWDQFFLDTSKTKSLPVGKKKAEPTFFYIGAFENERIILNKIDILNNINEENSLISTVVGLVETEVPSRVIFFENTNIFPIIKLFDIEKKLILKQIPFVKSSEPYCISDLYGTFVPPSGTYLFGLLEIESLDTRINIYKFKKSFSHTICSQQVCRNEDWLFEADRVNGKYFVEVERGRSRKENPFGDIEFNLRFFRGVRSKRMILYFLKKLNVYHTYIIKMILEFIPE